MRNSTIYLKGYSKLLIKYILYDLKIFFYILSILVAVFFYISLLLQNEADKILEEYGGLEEIKTTTAIEPSYNGIPQKDLQILLNIFNEYGIERINEIWINIQPLTTVGVQCPEDTPKFDRKIEGRDFTNEELTAGDKVVILSLEDYKCYFSDYHIGDFISLGNKDFQLIGVSYTAKQSVIPFNCIYNNNLSNSFICGHLVLKTKFPVKKSLIVKKYDQQTGIEQSDIPFVINPIFWMVMEDIFNKIRDYVISIILIIVFCSFAVFQTCHILYYKNLKHQPAFLYTGGSKNFLKLIIGGELFTIITISIILSRILLWGEMLWGK
ncbi:ABC transporter permease [Lacrimispora sp.]|uniref:ABC transporter permease n=1 Tax=Lacrimispora sp. TaxID=2719234 RepID=UPI0028AA5993|nr:ABC transporter permease [Lacrimispora sp.]